MEKKTVQLPEELIIQILLRLPVKSLVRFRCVCKSWLSLISDPQFAPSHFELAAAHTRRLVFIAVYPAHETRSIDLEASLNDDSASASLKLDFLLPQSFFNPEIGGSCRGFLFLHCYTDLYLWNPSTGVHKQIPSSPIFVPNVDTNFFTYIYGFGYDPSTDDYLVVLGSYDLNSADMLTHLEFFSLRANAWKEIEGTHLPFMNASDYPRAGTLLNGAIHWLVYRDDLSANVIVAFGLMERRVSEIPVPDDFDYDPIGSGLWVFGGFMSLWSMGDDTVEIWVMEEYKVHSSWTKTLVLSIDNIPTEYFSPICSTNCGDIVGTDGSTGLVKYNDKGQLLEHRSCCNDPRGSHAAVYIESLLPLPGDSEQA